MEEVTVRRAAKIGTVPWARLARGFVYHRGVEYPGRPSGDSDPYKAATSGRAPALPLATALYIAADGHHDVQLPDIVCN